MKLSRIIKGILFFSLCLCPVAFSYSDKVEKVHEDGLIELEEGRLVRLAGIQIAHESMNILPVLLQGQDVKVDRAKNAMAAAGSTEELVYIYLKVKELEFPVRRNASPDQNKMMINELLLELGAAWVDQQSDFSKKEDFLEIQAQAKSEGHGIWSYSQEQRQIQFDSFMSRT